MTPLTVVLGIVLLPLILVFIAVLLVLLLLYVLLWILPGFGYCYEQHAVRRHHERFYPRSENDSLIPLQAMGGKKVHVRHTIIQPHQPHTTTPVTPTPTPIPIINVVVFPGAAVTIAATDFITRDVKAALTDSAVGGELKATIRLIQFEHVSYGYSDHIEKGEEIDLSGEAICRATHQLLCLILNPTPPPHDHSTAAVTHPPIVAWGQSYGGQLAQLYRYLYPDAVSALLLIDPSPTTLFSAEAPMGGMMNKAAAIYATTATIASVGFIRPIATLMRYSSGEVKEAIDKMPKEYVGQIFTASHLRAMSREFVGFKQTCQQLEVQYSRQQPAATSSVPLRVVSAMKSVSCMAGRTHEETGAWWEGGAGAVHPLVDSCSARETR